ncbi:replication initiator protein A [Mesomycoplasma bovoculi]|uniref:replication initiator protein A n=1 Tax=Mesomycoplasma bovoculi TaxID=45362 RepID=UPI0004AD46E6|nr:replication initiator protein A [Mesomycoplasma bovoculi]
MNIFTKKKKIEAFSFLKIPMFLLEDENFKILTSDAKILYSIMLQKTSLSYMNKWIDEKERVYIYFTLQEVQETFNKAKEKACKIIKELKDINLIEKKRQGLGNPISYMSKTLWKNMTRRLKNKI